MLDQIFGTTSPLTWTQESARAALVFFYGLLLVRLWGRRMFARWSALDIVVSVVIGSSLSRAVTGNVPLWPTLAAMTLLFVLHAVCAVLAARWTRAARALEGTAVPLAAGGVLDHRALLKYGISETDVLEALHAARLERVDQARAILLEPSGAIAVLPRSA